MIIEIVELDDLELAIVDALDGMVFLYGRNAKTQAMTDLQSKSRIALSRYGLCTGDQLLIHDNAKSIELLDLIHPWYALLYQYDEYPVKIRLQDLDQLSEQSLYMLTLIAGWSNAIMTETDFSIYHGGNSSEASAMHVLQLFGLIEREQSGVGHWSEHGRLFAQQCATLGAFPE